MVPVHQVIAVDKALMRALGIPPFLSVTEENLVRHLLACYSLGTRCAHGERASVNDVLARAQTLRYLSVDTYNMYVSALLYRTLPRTSLCLAQVPALKQL